MKCPICKQDTVILQKEIILTSDLQYCDIMANCSNEECLAELNIAYKY